MTIDLQSEYNKVTFEFVKVRNRSLRINKAVYIANISGRLVEFKASILFDPYIDQYSYGQISLDHNKRLEFLISSNQKHLQELNIRKAFVHAVIRYLRGQNKSRTRI